MSTCVAQLTPIGRGAIASVVVHGPEAARVVSARFHPHAKLDWQSLALGRIVVGLWRSADDELTKDASAASAASPAPGEELVVCRTSVDRFEMHGHGGQAAVGAIIDDLVQLGCEPTEWHDSRLNESWTRSQLEAQIDLSRATTQRSACILLDQWHGALDRALRQLAITIQRQQWADARQSVAEMVRYAPLGQHLVTPWRVVLAGPPNVGKSSLINALVGYPRTVVFDRPGTTRDVVCVATAIDGWPVELSDTAGIHVSMDPLEQLGVRKAVRQIDQADLVILVFDVTNFNAATHVEWRASMPDALVVLNKCDLQPTCSVDEAWLRTCALTRQGTSPLISAISQRLVDQSPPPGAAVPFRDGHIQLLRDVEQAIQRENPSDLSDLLSEWMTRSALR